MVRARFSCSTDGAKITKIGDFGLLVEIDSPGGRVELPQGLIGGSLTISYKPRWPLIEWLTGDYTFGRLRQQMKAKLRGKNWRAVR